MKQEIPISSDFMMLEARDFSRVRLHQPSGYEFLSFPDDLQQLCNNLEALELQVEPSIPSEQIKLEQEYNDVIAKMEQLNPHGKEEISEYQKLASQRKELEAKLNISAPISVKENTIR